MQAASRSRLETIRVERGLPRSVVAEAVGLSERQVFRLERGETKLKRRNALSFAAYYGVPVEDLLNGRQS